MREKFPQLSKYRKRCSSLSSRGHCCITVVIDHEASPPRSWSFSSVCSRKEGWKSPSCSVLLMLLNTWEGGGRQTLGLCVCVSRKMFQIKSQSTITPHFWISVCVYEFTKAESLQSCFYYTEVNRLLTGWSLMDLFFSSKVGKRSYCTSSRTLRETTFLWRIFPRL